MKNVLIFILSLASLLSVANTEEEKLYKKANENIEANAFSEARIILNTLIELNPSNPDYCYKLGITYFFAEEEVLNNTPQDLKPASIKWFKKYIAESNIEAVDPNVYYYLGVACHQQNGFKIAYKYYSTFSDYVKKDELAKKSGLQQELIYLMLQCRNGIKMTKNPARSIVRNLGEKVNSSYYDYAPIVSPDEKYIYFTTRREKNNSNTDVDGQYFENIFYVKNSIISQKQDGGYDSLAYLNLLKEDLFISGAMKAKKGVNSTGHSTAVRFSADGTEFYFNKGMDEFASNYQNNSIGSTKANIPFKNKQMFETLYSMDASEKVMLLVSGKKGGKGGKDIYIRRKKGNGNWSNPENIGKVINTEFDEDSPFITPDGKTIYFSSNRPSSMGGYDVFKSTLQKGKWSKPVNLGYPINSAKDELYYQINASGSRAYLSSNRYGGRGFDNYVVFNIGDIVNSNNLLAETRTNKNKTNYASKKKVVNKKLKSNLNKNNYKSRNSIYYSGANAKNNEVENYYTIQLIAVEDRANINGAIKKYKSIGGLWKYSKDEYVKISTGTYKTYNEAFEVKNRLLKQGFDVFITTLPAKAKRVGKTF